jgi:aminoglycoside phosphotransferase (APT) family kinase protein
VSEEGERLAGGHLSFVTRIGDTVRRPMGPWSPAVHALLKHLEAAGFSGAPRLLGVDDQDREIVEYIEGTVPWGSDHRRLLGDEAAVAQGGRLLRDFHDAVTDFVPPRGAVWRFPQLESDAEGWADGRGTIVCHNDATAWNLVIGHERWAFIDWDVAGPRPPIWDVAYSAIGLLPITPDATDLGWDGAVPMTDRLVALAEGYGLEASDRNRLADVIVARIRSSYEHLKRSVEAGIEPWVTMWEQGHGDGWLDMLTIAEREHGRWHDALGT